jgi:DNA mismatch repair ATPase MutS
MIGPFRQIRALASAAECVRAASLPGQRTEALASNLSQISRLTAIARWVGRDASLSNELVAGFWEYLNLLFLLDINALSLASGELRACGPALLRVIGAVGEVDAAISVASLRAGTDGWVRPRFQASWSHAVLTDIRHPLIADAVPNSITLGAPFGVLVTGSNMSGKSTFLRTVGVTAIMAQSINTCFATDYRAPVVAVQSCIGRADDLAAGKSYYIVEVEEVLSRVKASSSSEPHLFLFDELFRGTNAVERIAAGEAVLRELLRDPGHGRKHAVLVATHDAELVELLRDEYQACHFADSIGLEGLTFDHRLAPGPATTRNAITLLELHGAPPSVVRAALARAAELDRKRGASPLQGA